MTSFCRSRRPSTDAAFIHLVAGAVEKIHAGDSWLELQSGREVRYDYLVIATGVRFGFEAVSGFAPDRGYSQYVGGVDYAGRCRADVEKLIANPGPVLVGGAQYASCCGPVYEYTAILDTKLRRHRLCERMPLTFITSELCIGHLGIGGVHDTKDIMEREFCHRHIKSIANATVVRCEPGKFFAGEVDSKGRVVDRHELVLKHALFLPAFKGIDPLATVEGLVNPKGLVIANERQRSPKYPNVYAVGACVALSPVDPTPVPTGPPKTGYMIETMATATVNNIRAEWQEARPQRARLGTPSASPIWRHRHGLHRLAANTAA